MLKSHSMQEAVDRTRFGQLAAHTENAVSNAMNGIGEGHNTSEAAEDGEPGRCRLGSVKMQWGGIAVDSGGGWEDFCRDHDADGEHFPVRAPDDRILRRYTTNRMSF
jgi:hypothetical protein